MAAADVSEQLWDAALDSTAKGFMFAAQAAHRHMAAAGGGVIVAITDVAGLQPWPLFGPHGAAKAAQIHLVKSLALAWGRDGVRVCGVAPGPVLLPGGERGATEETVLGTIGEPADVCRAVRFCVESDFAHGLERRRRRRPPAAPLDDPRLTAGRRGQPARVHLDAPARAGRGSTSRRRTTRAAGRNRPSCHG